MPTVRLAFFACAFAAGFPLALLACESAINLDVTYTDASASEGSVESEGGEGGTPLTAPKTFTACPCDETQGLGCCIPKDGNTPPFCTTDTAYCTSLQGEHLKCGRPDPLTESVCCWTFPTPKSAVGAVTALASACDAGPSATACSADSDCAGTGKKCNTVSCGPVTIGQCADTPPPCAR
jgi:hypothetical protein